MISNITIIVILIILVALYSSNYYKGLYGSVFFLLLMPKNLLVQISSSFPLITIHRFIIILMLLMWIFNFDIDKKIKNIPFINLLLIICVTSAASTLNSNYFIVSFKQYIHFLFESLFFYIILFSSIKNKNSILSLVRITTLSLSIVAIIGITERYTTFNPSELFVVNNIGYDFEKVERVTSSKEVESTYLHRILFGIPMALGIFYSLMLMGSNLAKPNRMKLLFLICLFGAGLFFSMSRGPWLAFILAALVILIVDRKSLAKKILIIFLLSAVAFMFKPGAYETVKRLYSVSFEEKTSRGSNVQWRFQILDIAYKKVTYSDSVLKFLFGYGQGSHLFVEFPEVKTTTGYIRAYESWDNQVAIILLEKGWIGIILVSYLYFLLFVKGMILYKDRSYHYRDIVLLALGAQLIIVLMKTNVSFFAPQLIYIEFVNITILSSFFFSYSRSTLKPSNSMGAGVGFS